MLVLTRIPTHVVDNLIKAAVQLHSDSWVDDYETHEYVPEVIKDDKCISILVFGELVLKAQDLWEGNEWRVDVTDSILQEMLRSL